MKRHLWFCMVLMLPVLARAQYDAAFTNYWALQNYYNPAASGLNGQLDVQAAYSMQMVGFENAPATMLVSADLPIFFIGPRHGIGVGFMNDKAGLFANKKFYLQYAYHQPIGQGHLSAGVRAAMLSETFDGSKVDAVDTGDPVFASSEVNGTGFDLDAGLRFTHKKGWYAGLSAMHLTSPVVKLGDDKVNEISIKPLFYATAGYILRLRNKAVEIPLTGILRTDLLAWRGDVSARVKYKGEKFNFYAGVTYSPTVSAGVLIGTNFHGINIGYSYEVYTGGVGALNGTHEIMLGYSTDLNLFKKGKNKHQAVRIL
ncbi:MAG: PorP/SprF family type IX secretion system membrane protein [Bacteroidales bacterium]|nr:PorP/SprF family type IX secretion system membrane protein [Candidatus Physcousia equi]